MRFSVNINIFRQAVFFYFRIQNRTFFKFDLSTMDIIIYLRIVHIQYDSDLISFFFK